MGTNEGWPEAFGFSIIGSAPVMIHDVEAGGSAEQAGLQIGDFIVELDGESVDTLSGEEVLELARQARKVPPSLVVVSRMRKFTLKRSPEGGFGITFRGNRPVFVRSVDFNSHAHSAGLRSGDLLVQLNGKNVRHSTKIEVLELLKAARDVLRLTVVAGGLGPTARDLGMVESRRGRGGKKRSKQHRLSQHRMEMRYEKARLFHNKMDYYLMGDKMKKTHLLTLLRLYSKDRDINSLSSSLNILLDTPIERRLFGDIRSFVHPSHYNRFDVLVSYNPRRPLQSSNLASSNQWRGSLMWTRPLGTEPRVSPMRNSLPDLSAPGGKVVQVNRGHDHFGFTLSGNAPVFIRSVDKGGAAERAGLQPGDQIWQLNGINIRGATHSQVVRLLHSSGPCPTMVVSPLSPATSPVHRYSPGAAPPGVSDSMTINVANFKDKMKELLAEDERKGVMKQLSKFSVHKEVPELVNSLTWVLDSPAKMVLFHYICQLLPDEAQAEFDRVAAAVLAGEPAENSSAPMEGEMTVGGGARLRLSSSSSGSSYGQPVGLAGSARLSGGVAVGGGAVGGGGGAGGGTGGGRAGGGAGGGGGGGGSAEQTPVKDSKSAEPQNKPRKQESEATTKTPTAQSAHATSVLSTPGAVPLPPNPPPTPAAGVGGVPIPPPPPPALPGAAAPSHLKRVNWEKLHGTEGTIWKELSGLEETLEYLEIEEKFANQKSKDVAGAKKNEKPAILEQRKAYNISILLGLLKLPFDKIKEAIFACDDSVLSEQHLRQMEAFAPSKKECLGYARFHGNPSVLSPADQFSCEMSTIPGYQQRLRAMIFKLHFKGKVDEIKPDLEAISKASRQLQTSKNFKRVLEVVLAVGNYMNAGNQRVGGAVGFRIKFLTQLKHLKTTDNKSTLLHFVAGTIERKFPQVIEFAEDLSFTNAAARVSGETLEVEVNELMRGLQDIQRDIEELSSTDEDCLPGDKFREVMTDFVSRADKEMSELLKLYAHMKQEYASVLKFFGEDPSNMQIDEFFSTFAAFIAEFERAVKENQETREKMATLERKKQEMEQSKRKKGSFKFFSRSSKNMEEEIRKEFEAKSRAKKIDVQALEESRKVRTRENTEREQKDFRHLLRRTDQPRQTDQPQERRTRNSGSNKKRRSETDDQQPPTDFRRVQHRADHQPKEKRSSKRQSGEKKIAATVAEQQVTRHLSSRLKRGGSKKRQGSELTGSWDFIPSPPTSTVNLEQEDDTPLTPPPDPPHPSRSHQRMPVEHHYIQTQRQQPLRVEQDYGDEQDSDGGRHPSPGHNSDLGFLPPPVFDLSSTDMVSGVPEAEWDVWNQPHVQQQEFDYETQF